MREFYKDAVDGDIYYNPMFCDLWVVIGDWFFRLRSHEDATYDTDCVIEIDLPIDFVFIGHINSNYIDSLPGCENYKEYIEKHKQLEETE